MFFQKQVLAACGITIYARAFAIFYEELSHVRKAIDIEAVLDANFGKPLTSILLTSILFPGGSRLGGSSSSGL